MKHKRKRDELMLAGQNQILEMLAIGCSQAETLQELCTLMSELLPGSRPAVFLVDEAGRSLRVGASTGLSPAFLERMIEAGVGESSVSVGRSIHLRETVVTPDVEAAPEWAPHRAVARDESVRACWALPIRQSRVGALLGAFAIHFGERRDLDADVLARLSMAAHVASLVIRSKQAEESQSRNQRLFRILTENAPVCICMIDPDHTVHHLNRAGLSIFGADEDHPVGGTLLDLIAPIDRARVAADLERAYQGEPTGCEFRVAGPGLDRILHSNFIPLPEDDGVVRSVLGISQDISHQKQVEEALRETEMRFQLKQMELRLIQAEKLASLGQLAAGMAHEINNPLTGILGFASMLLGTEKETRRKDYLERIVAAAHRINKIVVSMRHFASPSRQVRSLADINDLVVRTLPLLENEISKYKVEVSRRFQELPDAEVDSNQIQQVFTNLVMNALHAMDGPRRELAIETGLVRAEGGPELYVCFTDTGRGIRPEHMDKIFDPFFTTKSDWSGTGLGLSVSYTIVKNHGGRIEVQSEVGSGSVFTVFLPVSAREPRDGGGTTEARAVNRTQISDLSILLIEDEPVILEMFQVFPELVVHPETSGRRGLERARREAFDVALVDLRLPDMSGLEVIEALRRDHPSCRVLLITGCHEDDPLLAEVRRRRPCDILFKPFTITDVVARIEDLLEHRQTGATGG